MMKFDQSRVLYKRACRTAPGGIHSNVRANWQPVPMFYDRGEGSHVWDIDGNEFIDYVLARGPLLLGHSPGPVIEAAKSQMDRGLMYAGQHILEISAAERFCRLVPCADMVRFAGSGSEAVHGAIRLARAVTGRTESRFYTFRTMKKNPGFVAVAVFSLAIGIGVNTGIFSIYKIISF